MRHRSELVGDAAKQLHLMQKVLSRRDKRCRSSQSDITEALQGDYREDMSLCISSESGKLPPPHTNWLEPFMA
ncbi:MAG: hypothetical protein ACK5NG_06495 [Chthoniobacterales bacterium]